MSALRLGVNVDHVATIRNARGGGHPDVVRAAQLAEAAGADGITAHLREDRRHISDADIARLMEALTLPLNLEMAATEEMQAIALRHKPHAICLVPEKRAEVTTEGGLDVAGDGARLADYIAPLAAHSRVSLFIDPDAAQVAAAHQTGAAVIEIHTGAYTNAHHNGDTDLRQSELARIKDAASQADALGLEVHAGHGLCYETVGEVAKIGAIVELNIGHFLVGEAIFCGLEGAIKEMRRLMDRAR